MTLGKLFECWLCENIVCFALDSKDAGNKMAMHDSIL